MSTLAPSRNTIRSINFSTRRQPHTAIRIVAQLQNMINIRPSLKSALRPPPSALAESANFRPFYVKRADFSPPPPATKKRRKLVKIRPRCPHLATKKRRKVVKIRPCGGWWVGGWFPPLFFFNLITVKWSWYKIGDVIDVIKVINMTDVMNVINQCK